MQDASDMEADGYVVILAAGEINNLPLQILNTIIVHVSNLIKIQLCCNICKAWLAWHTE